MANKETNNFKTAINELLNGKFTSDAAEPEESTRADDFAARAVSTAASYEETLISQDVVIEGNTKSKSKLKIIGEVVGKFSCSNDIIIAGKVGGEIEGKDIILADCSVNNNIISSSRVKISEKSKVKGDITAQTFINNGVVTGNVKADSVTLSKTSSTVGDITCNHIVIEAGAVLKGSIDNSGSTKK